MKELLISTIITGIIALIALIVIIALCIKKDALKKHVSSALLISDSIILLIFMITSSVFGVTYKERTEKYLVVTYDHIYSVNLSNETKGTFSLGCGRVQSESYYYFYVLTDRGYELNKIKADDTYIRESEKIPHIEQVKEYGKTNPYNIIYVPVGTMVADYKVI